MSASRCQRIPGPDWHELLGPLPERVVPRRQRVAPADILETPEGTAIAGWEQLTIHLSAGSIGLRHVMVVVDADGQPISASDTVLFRCENLDDAGSADPCCAPEGPVEFFQECVGGRIEQDGTFRGTRWHTIPVQAGAGSDPQLESTPSAPSAADVIAIKALVAEVLRRRQKAD
jgi:hypothetical protein